MLTYRELISALETLGLDAGRPVIAHASLSAFGEVKGGAQTLLGALLHVAPRLVMPAFTFKCLLIPEEGPAENAITYGSGRDLNRMAQFFRLSMPVDPLMGVIPETLRQMGGALRSTHPLLSFAGHGVEEILNEQIIEEPLAPIRLLAEQEGVVLLLGVDHTVNTSIHHAEKLAGRKQFVRWALTPHGVRACPGYPGCSLGFRLAAQPLAEITRTVVIGSAVVQALPLPSMLTILRDLLARDPLALLCSLPDCERCNAVRNSVLYS